MSYRSTPRPRTRESAFTLVELLVVIGIIAVLISILLPALNTARRQANSVRCLSNMRQVGTCFMLYARDYKGCFPVMRQDYPDDGWIGTGTPPAGAGPQNNRNKYWFDSLVPYYNKGATSDEGVSSGNMTDAQFTAFRKSIFWGCPNWNPWFVTGTYGARYSADDGGIIDVFTTGYSMNYYPTCKADYPANLSAFPPGRETQNRWSTLVGRWYKQSQWTKPSERMLVCDANLWLLGIVGTNANGDITSNPGRVLANTTGMSNIDRFRHSRTRPSLRFGAYQGLTTNKDINTGKDAFNVLFADFHAEAMTDIRNGYKAIRMRYP